jgi:TPR repeat protein
MDSLILLYQTTICGNQESAKLLEGLSDSNIGHSKGYFALLLHWTEIYAVLRKDIPRANLLASEYLDIIKARGIRITDPKETEQLSFHEKFLVGRMLYDGIGTSKDTFAGYHLLVASADDGHPEALYRIGSHIQTEFGDLVESVERARGYLRSVVENFSHPQGTSMMARYLVMDGATARCYFDQNVEVGLAMYHHAADQGYALAQTELANYYERKNYNMDEAMRLWLLAAEQGFTEAIIALGNQYFHTRRVLDLSEGLRWYRRSVELGDLEIIRVYHFIVERGYCNVSKNPRLLKRLSKMLPKEKLVLDLSIPSHRAMNNIYEFQEMSNYGYPRFKDVPAQLSFPRKPTMFG